jgi:putative transposase
VEPLEELSLRQQCELLSLCRSGLYYEPAGETAKNLALMRRMDELFTASPFYGSRRLCACLAREGHEVNRKRVRRLMAVMGLEALYAKPRTTRPDAEHEKYPYLLRGLEVTRPDQVWATDITYIRLRGGFLYLMAILDWFSRYVVTWEISNTLDDGFCVAALDRALSLGRPEIFNSDQGSQFTSGDFIKLLKGAGVRISMDGVGRAFDNIFVERLWRTVKYEEVYLKDYEGARDAVWSLGAYLRFYNDERPHQSLGYQTPAEVYGQREPWLSRCEA